MVQRVDKPQPSDRELADVARLADGTIDPARRADAERRIAESPQLSALYERERGMVQLLRRSGTADRAPARLRAKIDSLQSAAPRTRARRRGAYAGALAAAVAAVAVALVLLLPGGTPAAPTVAQAAGLATLGPAQAAPGRNPHHPTVMLDTEIEGMYFPNWEKFGWRADGQRWDHPNGRSAVTVFYRENGRQLAYTIVGVPALQEPTATVTWVNGTKLQTLRLGGRTFVTWRRDGHTCLLSGDGVTLRELQTLAAGPHPAASA